MIRPDHPGLSIVRQCRLASIGRSSFYHVPRGESPENLGLMGKIGPAVPGDAVLWCAPDDVAPARGWPKPKRWSNPGGVITTQSARTAASATDRRPQKPRHRRCCLPVPLRSTSRRQWRRRKQCTDILHGPLSGGRSNFGAADTSAALTSLFVCSHGLTHCCFSGLHL